MEDNISDLIHQKLIPQVKVSGQRKGTYMFEGGGTVDESTLPDSA